MERGTLESLIQQAYKNPEVLPEGFPPALDTWVVKVGSGEVTTDQLSRKIKARIFQELTQGTGESTHCSGLDDGELKPCGRFTHPKAARCNRPGYYPDE